MQFKRELAEKIMNGEKTQTRRPIRFPEHVITSDSHQYLVETGTQVNSANRLIFADTPIKTVLDKRCHKRYQVGQVYAVQPGRGKPGIGSMRLVSIRLEDVRQISEADAIAEGFKNSFEFFEVWCGFYDKPAPTKHSELTAHNVFEITRPWTAKHALSYLEDWKRLTLDQRPADRYLAWALSFERVQL